MWDFIALETPAKDKKHEKYTTDYLLLKKHFQNYSIFYFSRMVNFNYTEKCVKFKHVNPLLSGK